LQTAALECAHQARHGPQARLFGKEPAEDPTAHKISHCAVEQALSLHFGAGVFKERGVIHASRTRGLAGEAAEAEVHLFGKGRTYL